MKAAQEVVARRGFGTRGFCRASRAHLRRGHEQERNAEPDFVLNVPARVEGLVDVAHLHGARVSSEPEHGEDVAGCGVHHSPLAAEFLEVEVAPREVLERRLRARRLGELGRGGDASATRPVDGAEECALGELDVRGGRGGGR